ncbi:hypothetical protein INT45_001001 [Circinella minor]|uniref:Uncharacterized protein n=1 Tax=Circinella minor TaxID=1195481 RepID=A0A8H7SC42_9FUNG|nr:hypothetical protein INT45_001001 [Circinella minor]
MILKHKRNTNGPTWIEYLATYLGADLYDQAYSGATANNVSKRSILPRSVPDISEQILEFNSNDSKLNSAETLYIIWTGVNDVHDIYVKTNDITEQNILLNSIVDSVTKEVNSFHPTDHLLIMGLAPIERLPLFSSLSDPTALIKLIRTYNEKLKALAASRYPSTKFINANFMFEKYIAFHNSYKYVDTTQACTLDLEQCIKSNYSYLWWDEWHPTTKTHQLIATDVFFNLHK